MKKATWLVSLALAGGILAGCAEDSPQGEPPPPPKTYTEEEIAQMPPQVQQRVRQQQQYSKGVSEAAKPKGDQPK